MIQQFDHYYFGTIRANNTIEKANNILVLLRKWSQGPQSPQIPPKTRFNVLLTHWTMSHEGREPLVSVTMISPKLTPMAGAQDTYSPAGWQEEREESRRGGEGNIQQEESVRKCNWICIWIVERENSVRRPEETKKWVEACDFPLKTGSHTHTQNKQTQQQQKKTDSLLLL